MARRGYYINKSRTILSFRNLELTFSRECIFCFSLLKIPIILIIYSPDITFHCLTLYPEVYNYTVWHERQLWILKMQNGHLYQTGEVTMVGCYGNTLGVYWPVQGSHSDASVSAVFWLNVPAGHGLAVAVCVPLGQ